MGFPKAVRDEAMVRSARRCCVCRRFKGVGVEAHHIIQVSDGGEDTMDNAIVLCFDCHAAAGHYNVKHPRGTKFKPSELIKHRDKWWAEVEHSGTADPSAVDLPPYHVRHLVCLDYDATRELLQFEKERLPFDFDFVADNQIGKFMVQVLADALPYTWGNSHGAEGSYWANSEGAKSLDEFHKSHPEFKGQSSRPIVESDFGEGGIRSRILAKCFQEGITGERLGSAVVVEFDCGSSGPTFYYSVRRPIFVFCEIKNTSDGSIVITKFIKDIRSPLDLSPDCYSGGFSNICDDETAPLPLNPGQSVIIPEMVLLSAPSYDDVSADTWVYQNLSREQGQEVGYRCRSEPADEDYMVIGPASLLSGFTALHDGAERLFPAHSFDPDKCYLISRFWKCGSCPHVFFRGSDGNWRYSGEVLVDGHNRSTSSTISVPDVVDRIRISEVEPEVSIISSVQINGVERLIKPTVLARGDYIELAVRPGEMVTINGSYEAEIPWPHCPAHLRQKTSLIRVAQEALNAQAQR